MKRLNHSKDKTNKVKLWLVLIISSSPRKGGNSDLLCDEFMKGALEAGNEVEKIVLKDKTVHPCTGCSVCSMYGKPCPQKDDAAEIVEKMIAMMIRIYLI